MTTGYTPKLVMDRDSGKLCVQIAIGPWTATQELPDRLATYSKEQLEEHFDQVVPIMIAGIEEQIERARRKQRRLDRKAKQVPI